MRATFICFGDETTIAQVSGEERVGNTVHFFMRGMLRRGTITRIEDGKLFIKDLENEYCLPVVFRITSNKGNLSASFSSISTSHDKCLIKIQDWLRSVTDRLDATKGEHVRAWNPITMQDYVLKIKD